MKPKAVNSSTTREFAICAIVGLALGLAGSTLIWPLAFHRVPEEASASWLALYTSERLGGRSLSDGIVFDDLAIPEEFADRHLPNLLLPILTFRGAHLPRGILARLNPAVERLALDDSNVTDDELKSMPRNLVVFSLRGTAISDAGVSSIATLADLEELSLQRTEITDKSLSLLSGCKRLRKLVVSDTSVTDSAISAIVAMQNLKEVDLADTRVTTGGIARLKAARPDLNVARAIELDLPRYFGSRNPQ